LSMFVIPMSGMRDQPEDARPSGRALGLSAASAPGPAAFRTDDDSLDPVEIFPCDQAKRSGSDACAIAKQIRDINGEFSCDRGKDVDADIDLAALDQRDMPSGVADPFGKFVLAQAVCSPQLLHGVGHPLPYRQIRSHRGGNYRRTATDTPHHIVLVTTHN
jgi:hypothetical protein